MDTSLDHVPGQGRFRRLSALLLLALAACEAARDDVAECDEDGTVTIDVLANDRPRAHLEEYLVGQANHGRARTEGDHVVYVPDDDFHGDDSFDYEVSWGLRTERARVTVHVSPDDPPHTADVFPLPFAAYSVATLDVDGDRRRDVLTTDDQGNISLLRATGASPADYAVSGIEGAFGPNTNVGELSVAVADWNRDGADDAIVGGVRDHGLVALLGPATTASELAQVQLRSLSPDRPLDGAAAVAGDFDGDGQPDLVVEHAWDRDAPYVLFTNLRIDGTSLDFDVRIELDRRSPGRPQRVDANGDGFDDLMVADDDVALWLGSPSGLERVRATHLNLSGVLILGGVYPDLTLIAMDNYELVAATSLEGPFEPLEYDLRWPLVLRMRSGLSLVTRGAYSLADFYAVDTSESVALTFVGDFDRELGVNNAIAVRDLDGDGYDELLLSHEIQDTQRGERSDPRLTIRRF